jgi:hypothetical protein
MRQETRKTISRCASVNNSATDSWRDQNIIGQGTEVTSDEEQANLLPIIVLYFRQRFHHLKVLALP